RVFLKPCLPQTIMREVSRVIGRRGRPGFERVPSSAPVAAPPDGHAVSRVRDEFAALPGLSLTTEQARLGFGPDPAMCGRGLDTLVAEGFLSRTPQGSFRRLRA